MADVLHVGQTAPFTNGSFSLADVDTVFVDELSIEQGRILAGLDPAGDVEPVAVA